MVEVAPWGRLEFVTSAGLPTDPYKVRRIGYALIIDERGGTILIKKEVDRPQ